MAQLLAFPFRSIRIGTQMLDFRLGEEAHATQALMAQVVCQTHKSFLLSVRSEKIPLTVANSHAARIGLCVSSAHRGWIAETGYARGPEVAVSGSHFGLRVPSERSCSCCSCRRWHCRSVARGRVSGMCLCCRECWYRPLYPWKPHN